MFFKPFCIKGNVSKSPSWKSALWETHVTSMFSFVSVWLVWDSEECVCWGEYQNRLTDSLLHAMKECAPLKAIRPWNKNTKLTKNKEDKKSFFLFCRPSPFKPSFRKFSTKVFFFCNDSNASNVVISWNKISRWKVPKELQSVFRKCSW